MFGVVTVPELTPRYNIAPTQSVLCVRQVDRAPEATMLRWGLIPSWAKDPSIGNKLVNARAETVATKPSFRSAFKSRRCLIAADGFYEWEKLDARRKRPWYFHLKDDRPFAFAGLWESWRSPDGGCLETCTLITGEPNELTRPIHDRMPVIVPPERHDLWLDPQTDGKQLQSLLVPYPAGEMEAWPVSTRVNAPKNEGPDLIERET